ncbi:hypothetical protein KP509_21G086900 [Ceratopteris richardii]|uniref:Uncharacterized protein n=1 Tax=Ceratopteris richardii TaxID=49495 RepID=A0A8T2SC61_CERRI|nr:hypothetical protein KP509_21G086900 [Ceratopteris richardii]KAH7316294.1 hypothetical protein KP509_21G086900 [Ceratopteris richardii]KAH7316295.1 hypothetical protein KP509_21G086900 [Ceratopteris richardii]
MTLVPENVQACYLREANQSRPHTSLGVPLVAQTTSSRLSGGRSPDISWKSSSRYIDPGYGFYKEWRPSRSRVEGGGDSHFGSAIAPNPLEDENQWRSSIRYIDPGSGSCSAARWRPSVKSVQIRKDEKSPQWKPGLRVFKLSECCEEWQMRGGRRHVSPIAHCQTGPRLSRGPGNPPPLTWSPPFRNFKLSPPKSKEVRQKVPSYSEKHPQLHLFRPTLDAADKSDSGKFIKPNEKEIRAKVAAYFKAHPPLHLFSSSGRKSATDQGCPSKGEEYRSIRRYIPEGHEDHMERNGCTPRPSTKPSLSSIKLWCATGPQHDPVNHRNVIIGKIGPSDHWKPPKVTLGPSLLAPAGNYNKDIIDSRFAPEEEHCDPEIPSYSSTLLKKPN